MKYELTNQTIKVGTKTLKSFGKVKKACSEIKHKVME